MSRPVILSIAGHDPSGGAGIQADIETAAAHGCHAATVVTSLTVQNTEEFNELNPTDSRLVTAQLHAIMKSMPIAAIKVGLLGSADNLGAVAAMLRRHRGIPVVFDPVLASGSGKELVSSFLIVSIIAEFLKLTSLCTPNLIEARKLSGEQAPDACAAELLKSGTGAVLITGGHGDEPRLTNRLYRRDAPTRSWELERLAGDFHGTGCTLSTAIACNLATGAALPEAIEAAQHYVSGTLREADNYGPGQRIPTRVAACDC